MSIFSRLGSRVFGALACVFLALGPAKAQTIAVCDVLLELDEHRDKKVTIEGRLFPGRHGTLLIDSKHREECPQLTEDGVYWPSSLMVTWGTEENQQKLKASLNRLYNDEATRGRAVDVVLSGRIIVKKRKVRISKVQEDGDYWYVGNGYGMGGAYPAAVSVTSIAENRDFHFGHPDACSVVEHAAPAQRFSAFSGTFASFLLCLAATGSVARRFTGSDGALRRHRSDLASRRLVFGCSEPRRVSLPAQAAPPTSPASRRTAGG